MTDWIRWFKVSCKAYAVLFCFMETYLLLFPMFMLAYSTASPEGVMQCMLDINKYGEGATELVFWIVSFPFIAYGIFATLLDIFRRG